MFESILKFLKEVFLIGLLHLSITLVVYFFIGYIIAYYYIKMKISDHHERYDNLSFTKTTDDKTQFISCLLFWPLFFPIIISDYLYFLALRTLYFNNEVLISKEIQKLAPKLQQDFLKYYGLDKYFIIKDNQVYKKTAISQNLFKSD